MLIIIHNAWCRNTNTINKRQERKLYLPCKDINNKKVYYYLYERGISLNIIDYFIDHYYLFQEAVHHNLVFVSYKGSQPVFISKRGDSLSGNENV